MRIARQAEFQTAEMRKILFGAERHMHGGEMDIAPGALDRMEEAKPAVPLMAMRASITPTQNSATRAQSRIVRAARSRTAAPALAPRRWRGGGGVGSIEIGRGARHADLETGKFGDGRSPRPARRLLVHSRNIS